MYSVYLTTLANEYTDILDTSVLDVSVLESQGEIIIEQLNNLVLGFQILLYIAIAFLLWKVISILYKLFAGVFLGGL